MKKPFISTSGEGAYSYQWYRDNHPLSGQTTSGLVVQEKGEYKVEMENGAGCSAFSAPVTIQVEEYPRVSLPVDTLLCVGTPLLLYAGKELSGHSFLWSDKSTEHYLEVRSSGEYSVSVSNGTCTSTAKTKVTFLDPGAVEIPNVITPNGDDANEFFVVKNRFGRIRLEVYNRWDKPVYSSSDYTNEWNGEGLSPGVYFYQVSSNSPCFGTRK